jgi:hypothetical protein
VVREKHAVFCSASSVNGTARGRKHLLQIQKLYFSPKIIEERNKCSAVSSPSAELRRPRRALIRKEYAVFSFASFLNGTARGRKHFLKIQKAIFLSQDRTRTQQMLSNILAER